MESTPPPYRKSDTSNRTKSGSRISKLRCYNADNEVTSPINLSLEIIPCSPIIASPSPSKSPLPMHQLLKFSPSPLLRSTRSRTRLPLAEKVDNAPPDEGVLEQQQVGAKRKSKNKNYGLGGLLGHGVASPRNNRRPRKRIEQDVKEDKDFGGGEELIRPRKRRQSGRSKKDKLLSSVPSTPSPKAKEEERSNLDRIRLVTSDLIMWKDVAKSTLWFGFGSICFLSSCFASGIKFSIFSVISQLGLLFLVFSFFSNSVRPRDVYGTSEFRLKEEDILRVGRSIIPAANLVISKTRELFSGEPEMTLKVVPFLLIGAEFGHLITLWRLCVLGFFISFTCPKLYSCYSVQICKKVEYMNSKVLEKWESCTHKKVVAASALTAFWNLTSIRTRIFAAFLSLVVLRYYRQHSETKVKEEIVDCNKVDEEETTDEEKEEEEKQALIVVKKAGNR